MMQLKKKFILFIFSSLISIIADCQDLSPSSSPSPSPLPISTIADPPTQFYSTTDSPAESPLSDSPAESPFSNSPAESPSSLYPPDTDSPASSSSLFPPDSDSPASSSSLFPPDSDSPAPSSSLFAPDADSSAPSSSLFAPDSDSPDVDSPASSSSSPASDSTAQPPSVLPILFNQMPAPAHNPVLLKVCGTTDHPLECLTSISMFQTGESDPISVLKMEMQALHKGFEKALAHARKMCANPATPKSTKACLDTCAEMYDSGLTDIEDAITALSNHDIDKLKTVLSATVSDIDTCDEAFLEESDMNSPMKEFDNELSMIASNNLAITEALLK
ncbi:cell wall protein RBR3-like [Mercurialis annua]|uniref:cell wall protein RBR3-like n=1 Tax=Mercurialis annua TaxID=3986 RepID=UPI00215EBFF7|nr:cell wall protein RBR3-like [Mercurialis annua]